MVHKPSKIHLYVLIVCSIVLVTVTVKKNFYQSPETNQVPETLEKAEPNRSTDTMVRFFSPVLTNAKKTQLIIPLRFEHGIKDSWLVLDTKDTSLPSYWLISHPELQDLSWAKISDGSIHLYQQNPVYKTINEFLKNPPPKQQILMDDSIRRLAAYKNIQANSIDADIDLNGVGYILTTYISSEIKDGMVNYINTVDASAGTLTDDKKLTWFIEVPSASESEPFYVGDIHVDYQ